MSNFYQFLKICDRETVQKKFNDITKRRKSRDMSNHSKSITVNKRYYTDECATFISHYANDILDGGV